MAIQTYPMNIRGYRILWGVIRVIALFFSVGVAVLFIAGGEEFRACGVLYILAAFAVFMLWAAFYYGKTERWLKYEITTDGDGLWPTHRGKPAGLVRWESVAAVREFPTSQCLKLYGDAGEELLRIEYQVIGYDELRERISMLSIEPRMRKLGEATAGSPAAAQHAAGTGATAPVREFGGEMFPQTYKRSAGRVLALALITVLMGALCLWTGATQDGYMLLGYGMGVFFIAGALHLVFLAPGKLILHADRFELVRKLYRSSYPYVDIIGVSIVDETVKGAKHSSVRVGFASRRKIVLQGFGISTVDLRAKLAALAGVERAAAPESGTP